MSTLERRLEKLEKGAGVQECRCRVRTRVIVPEDDLWLKGDVEEDPGPDQGICEDCGGRYVKIVLAFEWAD